MLLIVRRSTVNSLLNVGIHLILIFSNIAIIIYDISLILGQEQPDIIISTIRGDFSTQLKMHTKLAEQPNVKLYEWRQYTPDSYIL